jgi:general secretion pathway protein F/type IV pilus assembly protein PilC
MPAFQYEALNSAGQRSNGTLDANDRAEAIRKLTRKGLQPSSVTAKSDGSAPVAEKKPQSARAAEQEKALATGPIALSRGQVIQFTEELTDLLNAGLQLESALHAMENRSASALQVLCKRLRELVRDGVPFSAALNRTSPSFGELYANLVAAGEASGSLGSILLRQGRYLNSMEALRGKMISALIYPAFIVLSGIALGVVFLTYLLPKLMVLIKATGGEMPGVAVFMMALSLFLQTWWWAILIGIALMGAGVKVYLNDPERRKGWHKVMLGLPVYGPLLRTQFEVQFLETLGNLLTNGLPLHRALELVRKTTMNLFLRERLAIVEAQVADGGSLSRTLEKTEVARPTVIDMIRVGEQTGQMAATLEKAAERFDRHLTKVLDHATALIQPVIMLVMAGMVGSMAWMIVKIVYSTLEQLNKHH